MCAVGDGRGELDGDAEADAGGGTSTGSAAGAAVGAGVGTAVGDAAAAGAGGVEGARVTSWLPSFGTPTGPLSVGKCAAATASRTGSLIRASTNTAIVTVHVNATPMRDINSSSFMNSLINELLPLRATSSSHHVRQAPHASATALFRIEHVDYLQPAGRTFEAQVARPTRVPARRRMNASQPHTGPLVATFNLRT